MLFFINQKGLLTEGIFRKSADLDSCRVLKDKLNSGAKVNLDSESVLVAACVLKVGNLLELPVQLDTDSTRIASFTIVAQEPKQSN